jgi:hypothetical protein
MRRILALIAVLDATAALAQGSPPTVGGKTLVQIKSHNPPAKPQSIAARLQACLDIDDQTKERLNCYDAIFPVQPKSMAPAAKAVSDCRFSKEEDQRLTCFNGFAERIPKLPQ